MFHRVFLRVSLFLLSFLAFAGCTAQASAQGNSSQNSSTEKSVSSGNMQSADIQKLGRVLSSMSDRSKEAIPNGNPEEFLKDLYAVLEEEKKFRSDDLSLYYLIDKKHNVGSSYEPKDLKPLVNNNLYDISGSNLSLRPDVEDALCVMARAALKDGIKLKVISSYRSYKYQEWLFQHWVDLDGLKEAERESARAGTSQHQLGAAIDFGALSNNFVNTPMGKWLYEHSEEYGWSLSFPQGYEDVTGFRWECWHFRYIGVVACRFQKKWFSDVQQFMIEFIDAWKKDSL